MSLEVIMLKHDDILRIHLNGSCTFSHYNDFQKIIREVEEKRFHEVYMHLSELTYIDSSGLGMLLLMREKCQSRECGLSIVQPRGQVKKMFEIAQLGDIFRVEH